MIRDTHHFGIGSEIGDVDNIVASASEWDASPESRDPDWSVVRSGDRVRATRLTLPTATPADDWLAEISRPSTVKDSPHDAKCAAARRKQG